MGNSWNGAWSNPHFYLLPFIEQDNLFKSTYVTNTTNSGTGQVLTDNYPWGVGNDGPTWDAHPNNRAYDKGIKTYVCPSDPSIGASGIITGVEPWGGTTYAGNYMVFGATDPATGAYTDWIASNRIPASIQDGTSNTIMWAEKYGRCGGAGSIWSRWDGDLWQPYIACSALGPQEIGPASMFQLKPNPYTNTNVCDPARASTAHTGGMMVGLCDASVRLVNASISPWTWWYALTPNGGEVMPSDW